MKRTSVAKYIKIQPIKNGMHVNKAVFLRPRRSINGPTMNDPIGKNIVTKLARTKSHLIYN